MKLLKKSNVISILSFVLVLITLVTVPLIKNPKTPMDDSKENYKAIIEVWQIDSFEGGKGSRTAFLRKVASSFSKTHPSVLFLIVSHTVSSAKTLVEKGEYPDIISYGGNCLDLSCELLSLKSFNQNDGGVLGKNRYMVAWCKGGYFEITHAGVKRAEKVIVSQGEYNLGCVAKAFSSYHTEQAEVYIPTDAYTTFLSYKNSVLIGTQRDIFRLKSRELPVNITPIYEYCDLYQYLSVVNKSDDKNAYSMQFVNYLLSEKVQRTLTDIGMTSCVYKNLYEQGEPFSNLESKNTNYTVSPYASKTGLREINELALRINNTNDILKLLKHL